MAVVGIMASAAEARADEPPATTPLTRAIRIEDFAAARGKITRELVNQPDLGGYHPVTYAAYTRNPQLVKALLDGGADPNKVEHDGSTAMSVAACLNQPEIIRILHQAGADYPTGDKVTPPAANAVRADALDSLKVLLELYPALNINAGWPWTKDKFISIPFPQAHHINAYSAQSALMFATVAGYDEIARLLLNSGADAMKRGDSGHNALHYAARDCRISSETVALLIKGGGSPTAPSSHELNGPSTPLELASAAGSLEKVRVLAAGLDTRKQADVLRRAALIGAAHGKGDVASFLYQALGEKLPTIKSYIRDHPDFMTEPSKTDVPIPAGDISDVMPAAHPKMEGTKQSPGTIAVIASPALRNHAAMLTSALIGIDGMKVVERDEIDHLAEEKLLRQFGGGSPSGQPLDLTLIPAAQLVILEDLKIANRQFIKAALVSTRTRVVEQRMVLEYTDASETWVDTKLATLLDTIHRIKDRGQGVIALSLVPLTPATPSPECLELSRYANLLLPVKASQQPGAVLLNFQQMRHLQVENAISGETSYWKAGWVIEGSLTLDSPKSVRLVLSATGHGARVDVAGECAPERLAEAVNQAWEQLTTKLSLSEETKGTRPRTAAAVAGEEQELARQARWFVDAGYADDAYELASAAYLLGNRSQDLLRTMTEAAIDRLPALRQRVRERYNSGSVNPWVLDPAIRFRYAASIPDYLILCDTARLYVAGLDEQLVCKYRGKGVSGTSHSFNEVVSQALSELFYFRKMLDDSIICSEYRAELGNLDQQIGLLTVEFMTRFKDKPSESSTLIPMVFEKPLYFRAMHDQGLMKIIHQRLISMAEHDPGPYGQFVLLCFADWCDEFPCDWRGSISHKETIKTLLSSPVLLRQHPGLIERLRAATSDRTSDRVESIRRMLAIAAITKDRRWPLTVPNCGFERLLGMSTAVASNSAIMVFSRKLHGGIGGLILNPGEGFEKTGEYARLRQWYEVISKWSRTNPRKLEENLLSQASWLAQQKASERPPASDTLACREILKSTDRLTPKMDEILDQIAFLISGKKAVPSQEQPLAIKPLLSLPQSPGQSQFARWTQAVIDGDQLWLPATYFENPAYLWNASREANHRRNVIHVVGLDDHSIRTVSIPDDIPEDDVNSFFRPRQRFGYTIDTSALNKIILGSKHAYFRTGSRFLYSVNRQTLKVERINLPLPILIAMSPCPIGDTLYASIVKELREDPNGPKGANAVVAIEGSEIRQTLTSNMRKPPKTPLDTPTTWIDSFDVNDGKLVLFSGINDRYLNPEWRQAAEYNWDVDGWNKLPNQELEKARIRCHESYKDRFAGHRQISIGKSRAFFTEDLWGRGNPAVLVLANDLQSQLDYSFHWPQSPEHAEKIKLIPVTVEPLPGEVQMDRQMYLLDQNTPEDVTRSANQIIESGIFDVSACFKWRDQFLVFLSYRGVAMPAIWTASESEIQRLATSANSQGLPPEHPGDAPAKIR